MIFHRVLTLLENSWKLDPPGKLLEIRPSWKKSWNSEAPKKLLEFVLVLVLFFADYRNSLLLDYTDHSNGPDGQPPVGSWHQTMVAPSLALAATWILIVLMVSIEITMHHECCSCS